MILQLKMKILLLNNEDFIDRGVSRRRGQAKGRPERQVHEKRLPLQRDWCDFDRRILISY